MITRDYWTIRDVNVKVMSTQKGVIFDIAHYGMLLLNCQVYTKLDTTIHGILVQL